MVRISAKSRYALASIIYLAQFYERMEPITVLSISEALGISKIYLEQSFSLMRRNGLVHAIKGAQGGYCLTRRPEEITVLDVLYWTELKLREETQQTVSEKAAGLERVMHQFVFEKLDQGIQDSLRHITLADLVYELKRGRPLCRP